MEEPFQPYSDSLHSYTWKEDDDTIHLRRKKEKRARYTSHEDFLNKCIATNLIPAGFKIHWTNNVEMEQDIIDKCAKIKQDTALQFMELTRDACRIKIQQLNDEISRYEYTASQRMRDETDRFEEAEKNRMKKKSKTENLISNQRQHRKSKFKGTVTVFIDA